MDSRRGFTLIELMITMVIMVILSGVAIVSLRSSQANARDSKRASDVETIARGLEGRYNRGMQQPSNGTTISTPNTTCGSTQDISESDALLPGTYPSIVELQYAMGGNSTAFCPSQVTSFITEELPGTSTVSLSPPSSGSFTPICTSACGAAEDSNKINAATTGLNQYNYVYEPIDRNNQVCYDLSQDCVRYNLYYRTEKDSSHYVTIRSQHQ